MQTTSATALSKRGMNSKVQLIRVCGILGCVLFKFNLSSEKEPLIVNRPLLRRIVFSLPVISLRSW